MEMRTPGNAMQGNAMQGRCLCALEFIHSFESFEKEEFCSTLK
jgi:hypothetical protein